MWQKKKLESSNYDKCLPYRYLPYKFMDSDSDGWIKAIEFKPPEYELVELQTNLQKTVGWRQLGSWFIRKSKEKEKVLLWRRIPTRNY